MTNRAPITFRVGGSPPAPRQMGKPTSLTREALADLSMCARYGAATVAIVAAFVMVADTLTR